MYLIIYSVARPLDSVVTLRSDQEVPGSIPSSTLGILNSEELFHCVYNLEWRRLHNEELHSLYRSPNILRMIKSRRLRWAGNVAIMEEGRSTSKILTG